MSDKNTDDFEKKDDHSEGQENERTKSNQPHWVEYKPNKKNKYQENITRIVGKNINCIVYFVDVEGVEKLRWHWDNEICKNATNATAIAHDLANRIDSVLLKEQRLIGYNLIGSALFAALQMPLNATSVDPFRNVKQYIETKLNERAHFNYLFISFLLMTILGGFTIIIANYYGLRISIDLIIVGTLGSVGAFVSILQRYKDIEIKKYSSSEYVALRGLTRITIGFIFGCYLLILVEAELLFGGLNINDSFVHAFAFISGFSERFIPEVIGKVEKKEINDEQNQ